MVLQWSHQAARPPAPTPACPSKDHALRGFADARSRELCSLGNPFRHLESVGAAACANGVLDLPVAVAWGDVIDQPTIPECAERLDNIGVYELCAVPDELKLEDDLRLGVRCIRKVRLCAHAKQPHIEVGAEGPQDFVV